MSEAARKLKRVVLITYVLILHLVVVYFVGEKILARYTSFGEQDISTVSDPTEVTEVPSPLPIPSIFYDPDVAGTPADQTGTFDLGSMIIPVEGVRPDQLIDSFSDARSDGRVHDAIDIQAPAGTPVLAAADGEIIKFFDSIPGGITIYQLSVDRKYIFYYGHLQRSADDVRVGDYVRQGRTIGFVGDTGNAGAGNYHLHFSVASVTDPKRYWEGVYLNPYPLLRN